MVNIGQILIKVGKLPQFDGWQMKEDCELLRKEEFIELMRAPGIPCFSASKTIKEKWDSLRYYPGLVQQTIPPKPDAANPLRAYVIDKMIARRLIEDTMPKRIRNNYIRREHYLKTGEVD